MNPQQGKDNSTPPPDPQLPTIKVHIPSSPRHSSSTSSSAAATPTPTANARRKIGVAVDLSDESAFAVRWAVNHYIRPGDAVVLLHVSLTSVLFGADWGSTAGVTTQHEFDAMTVSKVSDLAKPLRDAQIPYKVHIVKDHDMRERLCLEVERLGLSAVIMGSRGFGAAAAKRGSDGKLGSVSDYCVHHCVCPVVVVRYPEEDEDAVKGSVGAGLEGNDLKDAVVVVKDAGEVEESEEVKDA